MNEAQFSELVAAHRSGFMAQPQPAEAYYDVEPDEALDVGPSFEMLGSWIAITLAACAAAVVVLL